MIPSTIFYMAMSTMGLSTVFAYSSMRQTQRDRKPSTND